MDDMNSLIPPAVLEHLSEAEQCYLNTVFCQYQGYPSLQQIWTLMDEQWQAYKCDPNQMDRRIAAFYRHPVWLLNGLFIEQDEQSLLHRHAFKEWVTAHSPVRVADFGGGFGGLARLIGVALPNAHVEIVEPHPHPAAMARAADMPNVRFVAELRGYYDILVATDVFEHVPDPIGLAATTAAHLQVGGRYLIANCFSPVIQCHLPQLLHLKIGWDEAMRAMGLQPMEKVEYGRAYQRLGELDLSAARASEVLAKHLDPWMRQLPIGHSRIGPIAMRILSAFQRH